MTARALSDAEFGGHLFDLRMSDSGRPPLDRVRAFVDNEVEPITAEFFRLVDRRPDRWSYAAGQLELLDGVKARAKAEGLWNFFLPARRRAPV